jgi:hypothetical protein
LHSTHHHDKSMMAQSHLNLARVAKVKKTPEGT